VELEMLKDGLNYNRNAKKGFHPMLGCHCDSGVCSQIFEPTDGSCLAHGMFYKGITKLWQDCVCEKSNLEEWHKQECFLGECQDHGINRLPLCPSELTTNLDYKVSWRCLKQEFLGKLMMGNLGKKKSLRKLP
jgi:hypothetical protein